MTPRFTSLE